MPEFLRLWNLLVSGLGIILTTCSAFFSPPYDKLRRPLTIWVGALSIFVFGFGVDALGQANRTWTGPATGGLWPTNGKLSGGAAPVGNDNVIISGDLTGAITAIPIISLGNLTINGTCNFQAAASGNTLTVTGTFTVASGKTFTIGNAAGRLNFTLSAAGTGTISGTVSQSANGVTTRLFQNNGDLTITSTGVLSGVGASDFTLGAGATLQIGSAAGITSTGGATGSVTVTGTKTYPTTADYVYIGTANQAVGNGLPATVASLSIANTGGAGANTVTLASNIAITNALTVSSGIFALAANNITAVGSVSMTGTSITGTGSITLAGNVSSIASATTATIGAPLALGGATRTFTVANGGLNPYLSVTSVISGAFAIIKAGAGILNLSGNSTYTGGTTISAGTLQLGLAGSASDGPLGTTGVGTSVTSGAVLDLNGFTLTNAEPLTLNGTGIASGGALTNSSATNVTYSGLVTLGSSSSIVANSGTIGITNAGTITGAGFSLTLGGSGGGSVSSIIGTGAGTVTKNGSGSWTVYRANTFSGGTTLNAGTLNINNASALGSAAGTFTINGGTIDNTTGGSITTVNYPQSWDGDYAFIGTQTLNLGTGAVTPNASRQVTVSAGTLTVGGVIGGGAIALTKSGDGTLAINGNNTFTGGVAINAGILQLGNAGALNSTTPNAVSFGASGTGTLQLNGNSVTISGLNTSAPVGTPTIEDGVAGTHTLTVNTTGSNTYAGILQNGAAGTLALTKSGAGSLALSGNNTYSGTTALSAGTLGINSATAIGSGTLTIAGGTTLDNTSAGAVTLTNNNLPSWNGDFSFTGTPSLNLGTGAVTPSASRQVTVNANTLTVGGVIAGGAIGLTKLGAGGLTLSAANTFTAGTTLNAGTLNINNASALGTIVGTFTINGGTIDNTTGGSITTLNYPQFWNGDFSFTGTQGLNLGTGTVTPNANRMVTVNANTLTVGGVIAAGAFNLTKAGGGTLSFGGNTVTLKGLAISAGTLTSTSGTLNLTGDFTSSGTFNHNSGTVNYNGGLAQTVAGVPYNNLTLYGAGQTNAAAAVRVAVNICNPY